MSPFKKKEPGSGDQKDNGPEHIPKDLLEATAELSDDDFDFGPDLEPESTPESADREKPPSSDSLPSPSGDTVTDADDEAPPPDDLLKAASALDDKEFQLDEPAPPPRSEHTKPAADPSGAAAPLSGTAGHKEHVPPGLASSFTHTKKTRSWKTARLALIVLISFLGAGAAVGYYVWVSPLPPGADAPASAPPELPLPSERVPPAAPIEQAERTPAEDAAATIDMQGSPAPKGPSAADDQKAEGPVNQNTAVTASAPAPGGQSAEQKTSPGPPADKKSEPAGDAPAGRPESNARDTRGSALDYELYRGHTHEKQGRYGTALKHYRKAAALAPDNYRLYNRIGYVLIRLELYAEALAPLTKALSLKKDYLPALVNTGIVYGAQKNYDEAQRYLSRALAIDATNPSAVYNMMRICEETGDFTQARHYKNVLEALRDVH